MSSKLIRGITIEIGGDTTKLGKALDSVESQSRSLQSELRGVNSLLKLDPTNTTLLAQKQELLKKAISETKEKLDILKDAEIQVQKQFEKGEVSEEQYRDLQREIEATELKLKGLNKELGDFGSVGVQQLDAVSKKLKDAGDKVTDAGRKISAVSVVAGAALAGVTKEAIDFESAWAGVTKTVDGTPEQLEEIKQGLLDMSQETASTAEEIAAVAEAAGQLGIKTENILEFTKTMVMLGDTTNLSADEAASALAKFANITQMSADDYGKLGAVIVDLGNNFATTEADIVEMATRLASAGEVTGLTEAQILALAAALSSAGIEAEAGGTAAAKMLKQLFSTNAEFDAAQAAIEATGSSLRELELLESLNSKAFGECAGSLRMTKDELSGYMKTVAKMNSYAETAGVSVEEFRAAYAEDAVGALSLFIGGLNDTERNGKSAVEILNEMGMTEIRLSNAVLAMASAGDLMTNAIKTANTAWSENTALTAEAEKRYSTTESKLAQLKNTISELCVRLGEMLLPIMQNTIEKVRTVVEWFTNLSPTTQKVILTITALVAALGPTVIAIGNVISAVGTIIGIIPGLVAAFNTVKIAFTGLGAAFSANPIGLIITAIGLLVTAFITLWNNCEGFRNFFIGLWEKIKEAFAAFMEWASPVFEVLKGFFIALWEKIKEIWAALAESLRPLFDAIVGAFKEGWELIKVIWDKVKPYFELIWEHIKAVFAVAKEVLGLYFQAAWEYIKMVWAVAVDYFKMLWENIKLVFSVVKTFLVGYFKTAWEGIKAVWNAVVGYFTAIWNTIKGVFSVVKNVLTGNWKGAWEGIKGIVDTWKSYFASVWESIKKVFSSVKTWFSSTFSSAWDAVKKIFSNWGSFFSGLWDKIKNTFSKIGTNISSAISGSLKSGLNGVISSIENIINSGVNLINDAINLINQIPGVSIGKVGKLSLPRFAQGVVADGPTVGLFGEDGTEAVVPLEKNTEWLDVVARKLYERLPGGMGSDPEVLKRLEAIYNRLARMKVVLDSGEVVGGLIDEIDEALGIKQLLTERGV